MAQTVFRFPCPCCGKQIEIDTRSGKARAANPKEKDGGKDLDDFLRAQQKEKERLENVFDSARGDHQKQQERLDELLKKAKEDAKKNEDDEPLRRPWDLE